MLGESKDKFVLKKGGSSKGQDVYLGKDTDPEVWNNIIKKCLEEGDWLVQEWVESVSVPFLNRDNEIVDHSVIWGVFLFGNKYGGNFFRAMPKSGDSIINVSRGAIKGFVLLAED